MKKNICKKTFAGIVAGTMILGSAGVFAADDAVVRLNEPEPHGSTVVLTGNLLEPQKCTITLQIIKPDGTLGEKEAVYRIDQIQSNNDGTFSVTVNMSESAPSGIYTVYAGGQELTLEQPVSFVYYTSSKFGEVIADIDGETTADAVFEKLEDSINRDVLASGGCAVNRYAALNEEAQRRVCENIKDSSFTKDKAPELFNSFVALEEVNSLTYKDGGIASNAYDVLVKAAPNLGIETGEKTLVNWLGKDRCISLLGGLMKNTTYAKPDDFAEAFSEESLVFAFSTARWTEMEQLLTICEDDLGIKFGASGHKKSVYQAMVGTYNSSDEIVSRYNKAVKEAGSSTGGSGSGGSGSGGSSSGGRRPGGSTGGGVYFDDTAEQKPVNSKYFSDLNDVSWAVESINFLADEGIVSGYEGKFEPNSPVLREEFVKMLVGAFGLMDENAVCDFDDVAADEWYAPYIASAVAAGAVNGVEENLFGTGQMISRQDLVVMLDRIMTGELPRVNPATSFVDADMIADYALGAVERFYIAGIVNGVGGGSFAPRQTATRAEAAKILAMVMKIEK